MKTKNLFLIFLFLGLHFIQGQQESNVIVKDTLIVGYNINAPFIYEKNGKLDGINYKMWKNITANDPTFYKLENYALDSLLMGLSNGTIDIGLSPLTITSSRNKKFDFSTPYYVSNSTGVVKEISGLNKLKRIFSSISIIKLLKVLGSLILVLSIFGFLVWIFERKKNEEFGKGVNGFWNGLWWSAVTMTTVGYGDKTPKTVGGRIIGFIWMFTAIILISSITAGITSSLTVEKLGMSNGDFSTFKKIKIGTVKNSATENRLIDNYNIKSYHTFDELLQGLKDEEVQAISHDEPLIRFAIANNEEYQDFEILDISFNQSLYAMGFSNSLDIKKKNEFSKKILKFTESNEWKILLSKYDLINKQNLVLDMK